MKLIRGSRKRQYLVIASIFLITATFVAGIAGCRAVQYNLTISSTEGGEVTAPGEGTHAYDDGTVVNLIATPDAGYCFVDWTGDVDTIADVDAATTTILVNGEFSITAKFGRGIWDWHDLDAIRDDLVGTYTLMNDLDSTTAGYEQLSSPIANEGKGWQPIGTRIYGSIDQPFTGSFDGQGYEIGDLFINRPDENSAALFGYIYCGAVIKNIGVVDANVTGNYDVGGLVGYSVGNVTSCYVTGSVAGFVGVGGLVGLGYPPEMICPGQCAISDCHSTGSVSGFLGVGGLVGGTAGPVTNSYSTSTVTCSGDQAGGLVGITCGEVTGCYATGSVTGEARVGGLVGVVGAVDVGCPQPGGSLSNSYAVGNATGNITVGGLVGFNEGPVINCYSIGSVVGNLSVGGLIGKNYHDNMSNSFWNIETSGQATSDGGTGKTTEEMQDIATFSGETWDIIAVADPGTRNPSYVWNIVNAVTYPFLSWEA